MFLHDRKGHVVNYDSNGRFNVKEGGCFIAFATKWGNCVCCCVVEEGEVEEKNKTNYQVFFDPLPVQAINLASKLKIKTMGSIRIENT